MPSEERAPAQERWSFGPWLVSGLWLGLVLALGRAALLLALERSHGVSGHYAHSRVAESLPRILAVAVAAGMAAAAAAEWLRRRRPGPAVRWSLGAALSVAAAGVFLGFLAGWTGSDPWERVGLETPRGRLVAAALGALSLGIAVTALRRPKGPRRTPWGAALPFALLGALPFAWRALTPAPRTGPSPAAEVGDRAASADDVDDDLKEMRALGYFDWDDGADPELRGVVAHAPELASPGYNFYTNSAGEAYVIDMEGGRVHTWRFPPCKVPFAELLQDGGLALGMDHSFVLADRHAQIVWKLPLHVHHDVEPLADGSFLVLYKKSFTYQGRDVEFDGVAHVSGGGTLLDDWSTFASLEELKRHHGPHLLDRAAPDGREQDELFEYYHTNSVEALPATPLGERDRRFRAGNWLICLHKVDVVIVLDQDDRSVVWSWGEGVLDYPHMPTMLADGNILVFDNGTHRGYTRVLEIDPPTGEVVWSYQADPPEDFFTEVRGSNQRLPNGNTLICESERGHAFEVTRDGTIVWEFWNPVIDDGRRERIYRFIRHAPELVEPWLAEDRRR